MNILTNEKSIRRNGKIGQYTSLASLVILGGGMYVSFVYPNLLYISFLSLSIGFVLSHAASQAISYDGQVPPGFVAGDA